MDETTPPPLHTRFPEWYGGLNSEQQTVVRQIALFVYHEEVLDFMSLRSFSCRSEKLQPEQMLELMKEMRRFNQSGTLQDDIGQYIIPYIRSEDNMYTFSDLLVQLAEKLMPHDGSFSERNRNLAALESLNPQEWGKSVLKEIQDALHTTFPDEAKQFALEWQRKRTLLAGEQREVETRSSVRDKGRLH